MLRKNSAKKPSFAFILNNNFMMRIGKIISIESERAKGIILDENDQEIPFAVDEFAPGIKLFDTVSFKIELGENGLRAVGV